MKARSHGGKKKNVTAGRNEHQGICPSCDNFALCSFIQGSSQPVIFCEEFANKSIPARVLSGGSQENPSRERAHSEKEKGLCATCENSNGCAFPKDEAGIWHCEEYR